MPVEIKELVIRAVVDPGEREPATDSPTSPPPADREAIVEECVREVLRILQRIRER